MAGWTELQQAFETASGRDLGVFFTQWLDRTGLPQISLDGAHVTDAPEGYTVTVKMGQRDDVFELDVPIRIETVSGTIRRNAPFESRAGSFAFHVADQPLSVSVDPNFDVLRALSDGELPPTVRDVLRSENIALVVAQHAEASADALIPQLLGNPNKLQRTAIDETLPSASAFVAIGMTEEILKLRADHFESEAPSAARKGDVRAWVEVDEKDIGWLFISADDLQGMATRLSALRYYANQSFVWIDAGARPSSGRWPVAKSPMQVLFE